MGDESGFWQYVTEKLRAVVQPETKAPEERVNQKVANCLEGVLRHICDGTMTYPFIEPDGDKGVCATWWANTYALQISVHDDASAYVILRSPSEEPKLQRVNLSDEALVQKIREHLHALSGNVKRANPNWQSVFVG